MTHKLGPLENFQEALHKNDLRPRNIVEKVMSWNKRQITDFAVDACIALKEIPNSGDTTFTFDANSSFSGGYYPCDHPHHRLDNLDSLARFAILYADRVYVPNLFENYVLRSVDKGWKINDAVRAHILGDIVGFLYAQPLFKSGLFSVRNNIQLYCETHLKQREMLERSVQKKISIAERFLRQQFISKTRYEIANTGKKVFLKASGPDYLIEHGEMTVWGELPKHLLESYIMNKPRRLTKKEVQEYGILDGHIAPILEGLFEQNLHVLEKKTQYLSNRQIDFDLISVIGTPETLQINQNLVNGVSHSVPSVLNSPLENLLELRQKEGEAFEVYRDKLKSSLAKAKTLKANEITQLINDEVKPEIHKIEKTIKNSKKLLKQSLLQDVIVGAGYIGIGIFTGFLSPQVSNLVTTLGGLASARALVEKATKLKTHPNEVIENPYYFLRKSKK